jgi:hypothetical protein
MIGLAYLGLTNGPEPALALHQRHLKAASDKAKTTKPPSTTTPKKTRHGLTPLMITTRAMRPREKPTRA